MPETLCGGRLAVDQVQRLIRIDGHPIGITEMEYRVLELLAFARNNVVTRQMLLKHLYRRADDQPQPKIIDVFISKLRKKLRNASERRRIRRDHPPARLDPARHRHAPAALRRCAPEIHLFLTMRRYVESHDAPPARSARRAGRALCRGGRRGWRSVRQALRLVDDVGGGPAPDRDGDDQHRRALGSTPATPAAACFDRRSIGDGGRGGGGDRSAARPSAARARAPSGRSRDAGRARSAASSTKSTRFVLR